jgi:hypothetical protein
MTKDEQQEHLGRLISEKIRLTAQRDDLLAALKGLLVEAEAQARHSMGPEIKAARAAIAKAEGK